MSVTPELVKVEQTRPDYPSQWDAWTADGQYLCLRYRLGIGSVEAQPSPSTDTWDNSGAAVLTAWDDKTENCVIDLDGFLAKADLQLATGVRVQ